MDEIIFDYPVTYLVYGGVRSGKTTIVREILNNFEDVSRLIITSSFEDYPEEINNPYDIVTDEYNIEVIDEWLKIEELKTIVLDDFLHIATANGKIANHLKSLLSTTRKKNRNVNIIISAQVISIGKYIRDCASVFFIRNIDKDSEAIIENYTGLEKKKIKKYKKFLIKNQYTFLICTRQGSIKLIKLEFS